jgi:tetratricopeptide (TPR) repeat protein/CHAT domain-containing protein/TPR repeat protein
MKTNAKNFRAMKYNIIVIALFSFLQAYVFANEQDVQRGVALYEKADQLDERGNHKAALELYSQSLQIFKNNLGSENNYVASTLNNMGGAYKGMGDINNALQCYKCALSIREKVLGSDHQYTGSTIGNIATILEEKGDYNDSLKMYKRAIAIYKNKVGPKHLNTLIIMNNLGVLYMKMGNFEKALEIDKECLRIEVTTLGKENRNTLNTMLNIGTVYQRMADFSESLKYYQEALQIMKDNLGEEDQATLTLRNNLGDVYREMGDYPKAIETLQKALVIEERKLGAQSIEVATTLNGLGKLYYDIGQYQKAISKYNQALIIFSKRLGDEHPDTLTCLSNIGDTSMELNDFDKAIETYNKVLSTRQKKLGDDHPDVGISYDRLACVFQRAYHIKEAIECEEKALAIMGKCFGPNSTQVALISKQLSFLYGENGSVDEAIEYAEIALLLENNLGGINPDTINLLRSTSDLYYKKGNLAKSAYYATQSVNARQGMLSNVLNMDAASRLAWREKYLKINVEPSVLLPEETDQLILRWKGIVLDSLLEDSSVARSASGNPDAVKALKTISYLQSEISKLAFSSLKKDMIQSEKLTDEISKIERTIAINNKNQGFTRNSASLTVKQTVSCLPENSSLIDFIKFTDFNKKVRCYGISILSSNSSPQFIRIDDADIIDDAVANLKKAITSGKPDEVKKNNDVLFEKLWVPIKARIPDANKKLFIGPDGMLNFLSFASLFDPQGKFLAEDQDVTYVASGRDLFRSSSRNFDKTAIVFANPLFDVALVSSPSSGDVRNASELSELSHLVLSPLPGTETEWLTLKPEIEAAGWRTSAFLGADATKQQIFSISKPGILHLATHGFYLNLLSGGEGHTRGMKIVTPSIADSKPANNTLIESAMDPMRASGIALTGAQSTLRAWGEKKCPPPENDGILTAENVSGLDLNGTWLVTLSACETGVGESKSGEGVFGLRRAFMMAGAQNLLMTLWPVSDETTPKIMADFYKKAFASDDAPGSLSAVQRDWLVKLRNEKGLLAAVRDAGPFAMVMMANPNAKPMPDSSSKVSTTTSSRPEAAPSTVSSSESISAVLTVSHNTSEGSNVIEFSDAISKADTGDAKAQAIVAIYYGLGYKADKDLAKAAEYASKSAAQNNPLGQYQLGVLTSGGDGVSKDLEKGKELKVQSIEGLNTMKNDPYALAALGAMALRGEGVTKDMKKAARLYRRSADMGYAPAQILYATMLSKGVGVQKDDDEAMRYMGKASDQNFSSQ